jgi:hypothetical protein
MAAKSTKLTYDEYKHLENILECGLGALAEVKETTADGDAYRKTLVLVLAGRELRFVGPWVTYAFKKGVIA